MCTLCFAVWELSRGGADGAVEGNRLVCVVEAVGFADVKAHAAEVPAKGVARVTARVAAGVAAGATARERRGSAVGRKSRVASVLASKGEACFVTGKMCPSAKIETLNLCSTGSKSLLLTKTQVIFAF